ncbi:MAG TPA: SHOCT domain-containing protein [Candidatus Limnocylindrales bacterium]|nr:SHOCT domain-containing protein [Candidatus Limnocylindrales bacterium]
MMPGFGGGMGGFGWLAMSAGWLVFLALAVAVVWLLARNVTPRDSARTILDQRYARGEIDDQEYQQRLRTLGP